MFVLRQIGFFCCACIVVCIVAGVAYGQGSDNPVSSAKREALSAGDSAYRGYSGRDNMQAIAGRKYERLLDSQPDSNGLVLRFSLNGSSTQPTENNADMKSMVQSGTRPQTGGSNGSNGSSDIKTIVNNLPFPQISTAEVWGYASPEIDTWTGKYKYTEGSNGTGENSSRIKETSYQHKVIATLTMPRINLSLDDEIFKSQMFYFQSVEGMKHDFLGDPKLGTGEYGFNLGTSAQLQGFLNIANTAFGIGSIALSFLDKSVAASLTSTQMMADSNATNYLLKQISQQTYQLNNPDRQSVFRMADEKFERCMFAYASPSYPALPYGATTPNPLNEAMDNKNLVPDVLAGVTQFSKAGGCDPYKCPQDKMARYAFCSCCADTSTAVNNNTGSTAGQYEGLLSRCVKYMGDGNIGQASGAGKIYTPLAIGRQTSIGAVLPTYSLVDRAFIGAQKGELYIATEVGLGINPIANFANNFARLYGDYCFFQVQPKDGKSLIEAKKGARIKMKFLYPRLSVMQQIEIIRNGGLKDVISASVAEGPGGLTGNDDKYCGSNGFRITDHCVGGDFNNVPTNSLDYDSLGDQALIARGGALGICPTIRKFLDLQRTNKYEDYMRTAIPATGNIIEGVKNWLDIQWAVASLGIPLTVADIVNIKNMADPPDYISPYQDRYVETLCDASAIVALKRVHLRNMSITRDYMQINTKLTPNERKRIEELVSRPVEQINMALKAAQANIELTISAAQEAARRNEARRGSIMASARAMQQLSQQSSEIQPFGGSWSQN